MCNIFVCIYIYTHTHTNFRGMTRVAIEVYRISVLSDGMVLATYLTYLLSPAVEDGQRTCTEDMSDSWYPPDTIKLIHRQGSTHV